jgi:hypothetical protein
MTNGKYTKFLDFPKLPSYHVDEIFDIVKDPLNIDPKKHQDHAGYKEFKNRKLKKINGQEITSVSIDRFKISKLLDTWLKNHVHPSPRRQHIAFYNSSSSDMGPHVDADRDTVWMYVIDPGGGKVETVWYQEPEQKITRSDLQNISVDYMNVAICDYTKLIELERYEIPAHTWVEINSSIIHSVEGLETNRLALQITP